MFLHMLKELAILICVYHVQSYQQTLERGGFIYWKVVYRYANDQTDISQLTHHEGRRVIHTVGSVHLPSRPAVVLN